MCELEKRVLIGGQILTFEVSVTHASGAGSIVLCRDESGELRYVTLEEWGVVSSPSVDGNAARLTNASERAPVTQASTLDEKVTLVMSLFRGRTDVYAQGYEGKSTKPGKLSYWPYCRLRWVRGTCPKLTDKSARCRDCDHPSYAPLTIDVVRNHCTGHRDRRGRIQAVGIYVVDGDVCYLLAADFDGPGWQDAAAAYRDACREHGLSPAVERSRSGNGAHVWVFFDGPVEASIARRVGEGLISEARNACASVSFRSYDRLFPLQDAVVDGDLGSLIALPLQGEAVRQGNSVFVDDQFEMLPDQCAFLSTLPKVCRKTIAALADEYGKDPVGLPEGTSTGLMPSQVVAKKLRAQENYALDEIPADVKVTLADGVRIDCEGLPARLINRLRRLAAFRNPEYTKKLRMHFSVWDTPRFVDLSRADGNDLVLPRGCAEAVLSTLREAGIKAIVNDNRVDGRRIHARFLGELRDIQKPCVDKLVGHDLGVIVAPTGFGKSVIGASIVASHQVNTLVIVPRTTLLKQWRESLTQFLQIEDDPPVLLTPTGRKAKHQPGVVGIVGDGKSLRSSIVDVALAGSLFKKGEVAGESVVSPCVAEYGMVIVDEAQHVAASKLLEVLGAVRARYVYAMTATPKRDDGLDRILFLECGPLRHEVAISDQIEEQGMRRLLVPRFSFSHPDLEGRPKWHELVDYISTNDERNHLVATDAVRAMRKGRTPLVLTRRVEHARTLANDIVRLSGTLDASVVLLVGSDDAVTRQRYLEELHVTPIDKPLCVVATGSYVGEGFDFDRLDTLLLAGPVAFEGMHAQWVGRLHRVGEGKSEVIAMDYVDLDIPMFDKEWHKRMRTYRKLGYQMAEKDGLALVGLEEKSTPTGHVFYGKEYAEALEADLADSASRVVISSSWARFARIKVLRRVLENAVGRRVAVEVVLREPKKPSPEWQQLTSMLSDMGCTVRIARQRERKDFVVIDDALVWYGNVAPLAYAQKGECSLRFVSREVAQELVEPTGATGCRIEDTVRLHDGS
ncbi:MAG: DEAD/DEAH box helicase family protein [Atopobiaceae bacterium]|nr:DEAD/DEAH box helicase family protein [Atopobiaceae bacterium]